jgi:toxin secretion/phage lysis holin
MNGLLGLRVGIGALAAAIAWFLGGWDGLLLALVALMAVDYLTGVLCAIIERKLSSEIGIRGIAKKVIMLLLVGVAHIVDTYLLGEVGAMRTVVVLFLISNEGISILENAARVGVPIPAKLKEILLQFGRDKKNGKDREDEGK